MEEGETNNAEAVGYPDGTSPSSPVPRAVALQRQEGGRTVLRIRLPRKRCRRHGSYGCAKCSGERADGRGRSAGSSSSNSIGSSSSASSSRSSSSERPEATSSTSPGPTERPSESQASAPAAAAVASVPATSGSRRRKSRPHRVVDGVHFRRSMRPFYAAPGPGLHCPAPAPAPARVMDPHKRLHEDAAHSMTPMLAPPPPPPPSAGAQFEDISHAILRRQEPPQTQHFLQLHHHQHHGHHHQQQQPDAGLAAFHSKKQRLCSPVSSSWDSDGVASTTGLLQQTEEPDSTTHPAVKSEPVCYLSPTPSMSAFAAETRRHLYASSQHLLHPPPPPHVASSAHFGAPAQQQQQPAVSFPILLGPAVAAAAACSFDSSGPHPRYSDLLAAASYQHQHQQQQQQQARTAYGPGPGPEADAFHGQQQPAPFPGASLNPAQPPGAASSSVSASSASTSSGEEAQARENPLAVAAAAMAAAVAASSGRPLHAGSRLGPAGPEVAQGGASADSGESGEEAGRLPETELSLYKNKMENVRCGVCGDAAAGFHCGAYVCEACKKFYIRSTKADNANRYQCSKTGQCEISKDTRTHCQYCRYKKCEQLGMYPPGSKPSENSDISVIPCRVCGAQSSGFHFGAITCEGCKGFFRRTINERESNRYQCSKGSICDITVNTRNNCKSCRYNKCLAVGMSKTGSRIGRQPNAIKHMCAKEIEAIQSSCQRLYGPGLAGLGGGPTTPGVSGHGASAVFCPSPAVGAESPLGLTMELGLLVPKLSPGGAFDNGLAGLGPGPGPELELEREAAVPTGLAVRKMQEYERLMRDFRGVVARAAAFLHPTKQQVVEVRLLRPDMAMEDVWRVMMSHFNEHAMQVIDFAKAIPGFKEFGTHDMKLLVQEAMYPITLVMLSQSYDLSTEEYNYFSFARADRDVIISNFPTFVKICNHLAESGKLLKSFALDDTEMALLCAIELSRGESEAIMNRHDVNILYNRCVGALKDYIREKGDTRLHFSTIALIQKKLSQMNLEHHKVILDLKRTHTNLVFPELYVQMFQLEEEEIILQAANMPECDSGPAARPGPDAPPQFHHHHQQLHQG